jgi:hypothetical protein
VGHGNELDWGLWRVMFLEEKIYEISKVNPQLFQGCCGQTAQLTLLSFTNVCWLWFGHGRKPLAPYIF